MSIIGILLLAFLGFALLMGGIFWFFGRTKGSSKKYPFLIYSQDGRLAHKVDAKVKVNKANKSEKVFVFPDNDTELPIKPPSLYIGNTGYRQISLGDRGQFVYLNGLTISKKEHLESSLNSEDVAFLTGSILENNREFENPMAKTTAALVIGMAIIALIIMVGTIYSTVSLINNSKEMKELAIENSKGNQISREVANTNAEVTAQLARIASALTGEANITRVLT